MATISFNASITDLELRGADTLLKLHSDESLPPLDSCLTGTAYTGECITLIDCRSPGMGRTTFPDVPTRYHAEVFPHYVVVGRRHLDPAARSVTGTTDLSTLFYDFDAFGDAKAIIDDILRERRQMRPVEAGEYPLVQYFTGKDCIADVATMRGRVCAHHRPQDSRGPRGVYIRNRIVISLEPVEPLPFADIVEDMYDLLCFLTIAAGRAQGVRSIQITITENVDSLPVFLDVYPSYLPKVSDPCIDASSLRGRSVRIFDARVGCGSAPVAPPLMYRLVSVGSPSGPGR